MYNIGQFGPDPILPTLAHNKRNIDEYYFLVGLKLKFRSRYTNVFSMNSGGKLERTEKSVLLLSIV